MYEIRVKGSFSSAHNLREYKGKCEAIHGHNWKVEVSLISENLNSEGMVMDFNLAKKLLSQVLDKLDHKYINEIEPFNKVNPTSENIAKFIFQEMRKKIGDNLKVKKVTVWETENSSASYYET
jgi:6-pyruvoyltetrahydropterin/6-carboxytetrahydropterin synthase